MTTAVRYLGASVVTVTIPAAYETGYPTTSTSTIVPVISIVTVVPVAKYPETSTAAGYVTGANSSTAAAAYTPSATPLQASGSVLGISSWLAGVAMGLFVLL